MRNDSDSKRLIRNALQRVAIRDHVEAVGGIGLPSKMPGTAYGISAKRCGVGGNLAKRPDSVCASCYAFRNNYTYPSVMTAHEKRYEALADLGTWVDSMCRIFAYLGSILPRTQRFHRWHDSGDLQSIEHLDAIVQVATRNDGWQFWIPTKEYGIVSHYLARHSKPGNLAIRVSAPWTGEAPNAAVRKLTGLTSTVDHDEGQQCPAPNNDGQCGRCRACWSHMVPNVNYAKH